MLMARRIRGHEHLLKDSVSRCCTRWTIFSGGQVKPLWKTLLPGIQEKLASFDSSLQGPAKHRCLSPREACNSKRAWPAVVSRRNTSRRPLRRI